MATKFYFCKHCGNVVVKMVDSGVTPVCCGEEMIELTPNTIEGSGEKHLPVIERIDDCTLRVKVGSAPHPMMPQHHIVFICLETKNGIQVRQLDPEKPAEAEFCGCKDPVVAVYEYCNLHGLWKTSCENVSGTCPTPEMEDSSKKSCSTSKKGCCSTK